MNAYGQHWAPPHNPTVEAQRPGYCLERAEKAEGGKMVGAGVFLAGLVTWGSPKDALVIASLAEVRLKAGIMGCLVTTVPRHNGHVREWEYR